MILHFGLCITYRVLFHPSKSAGIHSHAGAFRLVSKPTKWLSLPRPPCGSLRLLRPCVDSLLVAWPPPPRGSWPAAGAASALALGGDAPPPCGCDSAPAPWSGQPGNCGIDTGSTWVKITTFLWLTHVNSLFLMARWTNWRTSRIKQETPSKQVWQCA